MNPDRLASLEKKEMGKRPQRPITVPEQFKKRIRVDDADDAADMPAEDGADSSEMAQDMTKAPRMRLDRSRDPKPRTVLGGTYIRRERDGLVRAAGEFAKSVTETSSSKESIERYKARLVAQGYSQVHGVDYTETVAPTIRRESLRIFLAVAAMLGLTLLQMGYRWRLLGKVPLVRSSKSST